MKLIKNRYVCAFLLFLFVGLTITTAQMYEREKTLDYVRTIDFKVISNVLDDMDLGDSLDQKKALGIFKEISLDNGYVLFPLAIYSDTFCIESINSLDPRSICNRVEEFDFATFENSIQSKYNNKYLELASEKILVKQHSTSEVYLLGLAGKYALKSDGLSEFWIYISNDWYKTFSNWRGFKSALSKSWPILIVVLFIQLIYLLILWRNEKNSNIEHDRIAREKGSVDAKLKDTEDALSLSEIELEEAKKGGIEDKADLEKRVKDYRDKLISYKNRSEVLQAKLNNKTDSLGIYDSHKKLKEAQNQQNELNKLWIRSTEWSNRAEIEKIAAPIKANIPFTTSLGFIAFETYLHYQYSDFDDTEKPTIGSLISAAYKKNEIDYDQKVVLLKLNEARNAWFHRGEYPKPSVTKDLIRLLREAKAEPSL